MAPLVLVTGATGRIGRVLVEQLAARDGLRIVAASRAGHAVAGVAGRALDLLDAESARAAFVGVDRAFVLTPLHPQMEAMTAHAVAAARAAGAGHLVRISGAGADPGSEVAIARLPGRCDRIVIESGLAYTLLRPKNFMQNFATFQRDMVRAGTVFSSQGEGRVPFVDARDIAAVAAAVLADPVPHAGQAYTLTGPEALTNAQALALIAREIGREIRLVPVSEEQAAAGMRAAGMPEPLVEAMSSLNRVIAAGGAAEPSDDVQRVTGRAPASFAAFANDYRDCWL